MPKINETLAQALAQREALSLFIKLIRRRRTAGGLAHFLN
jgi:hypothetical protein